MMEKRKILAVENDIPLAMLMAHLVMQTGYEVQTARSLERGMILAQENRFDLIIVDTDVPGFDFFDVCLELRQRHISRLTPIMLLTHTPQVNEEIWGVDFLVKPFEAADFVFEIKSHMLAKSAAALSTVA